MRPICSLSSVGALKLASSSRKSTHSITITTYSRRHTNFDSPIFPSLTPFSLSSWHIQLPLDNWIHYSVHKRHEMKFVMFTTLMLAAQAPVVAAFVPASVGVGKSDSQLNAVGKIPVTTSSDTQLNAVLSRKGFLSIGPVAALGVAIPTLFPGSAAVAATGAEAVASGTKAH